MTDFYLHPDHDAALVRQQLEEIAESSSYRKPGTAVTVIVLEKPWGTHDRIKAYVKESREQFLFISDVRVRGQQALRHAAIQFAQATYAETAQPLPHPHTLGSDAVDAPLAFLTQVLKNLPAKPISQLERRLPNQLKW